MALVGRICHQGTEPDQLYFISEEKFVSELKALFYTVLPLRPAVFDPFVEWSRAVRLQTSESVREKLDVVSQTRLVFDPRRCVFETFQQLVQSHVSLRLFRGHYPGPFSFSTLDPVWNGFLRENAEKINQRFYDTCEMRVDKQNEVVRMFESRYFDAPPATIRLTSMERCVEQGVYTVEHGLFDSEFQRRKMWFPVMMTSLPPPTSSKSVDWDLFLLEPSVVPASDLHPLDGMFVPETHLKYLLERVVPERKTEPPPPLPQPPSPPTPPAMPSLLSARRQFPVARLTQLHNSA